MLDPYYGVVDHLSRIHHFEANVDSQEQIAAPRLATQRFDGVLHQRCRCRREKLAGAC